MQTGEYEKARAQAPLRYEIRSRESTILDSVVGKVPGLEVGKSRAPKRANARDILFSTVSRPSPGAAQLPVH
jgi:hypothetical protein